MTEPSDNACGSPRSIETNTRTKVVIATTLVAMWAGLAALGYRLFDLQVVRAEHWQTEANKQHLPLRAVAAYRGDIQTADGAVLARSIRAFSAFAEPRRMGQRRNRRRQAPTPLDHRAAASAIGQALGWPAAKINGLYDRFRNPKRQSFCWIQRRLSEHQVLALKQAKIAGVGFKPEYRRNYPSGALAAHTLGFTRLSAEGTLTGATGIERTFDHMLRGVVGRQEVVRDARGTHLLHDGHMVTPPLDGHTVRLTLDSYAQHVCEQALAEAAEKWKPEGIALVMLRPSDGRILAMASWPSYDPAELSNLTAKNLRNRTIMDTFEPGSILKPLTMAAALRAGVVNVETPIDCTSPRRFQSRTVRDVHNSGSLSLEGVLVHSSNVGMAQVAMALGPEHLHAMLVRAGFARLSSLGLPLEEKGRITALKDWSYHSTISVAQGYELSVTLVQMVSAFAALGADGIRYRPQLLERVSDAQGSLRHSFEPDPAGLLADPRITGSVIIPALIRVVEDGTGKRARMQDYTIAGKTGTAKKVINGRYADGRYRASFMAIAPAHNPQVAIGVMVDDPRGTPGVIPYGGTVAAPLVKTVLESVLPYLRVAPDKRAKALANATAEPLGAPAPERP